MYSAINPSQASIPGKSDRKGWVPYDTYSMVPTLVLLCGALSRDFVSLQKQVTRRLAMDFPLYALQWARIEDVNDASESTIRRCAAPLLNRNLWLRLLDDEYRQDVLTGEQLLPLRIIVVCNLASRLERSLKSDMGGLALTILSALSSRASVSLQLIVLGEGDLELDNQAPDDYWPRFKLGTSVLSGGAASYSELLEGCETLIAMLLTSELTTTINEIVSEGSHPPNWIAIGASAVIADLPLMQEYLWLEIYNGLVNPLVSRGMAADGTLLLSTDIPPEEQKPLNERAASIVASSMNTIRLKADHIVEATSLYPEGTTLPRKGALDIRSPLMAGPFLLRPRFVNEHSDVFIPRLEEQLRGHYQDVISALTDAESPFPPVVAEESGKMLNWSAQLLNEVQDRPLAGLPVVVYAINQMVDHLKALPEMIEWPLAHYQAGISVSAADTDAAIIGLKARSYRRYVNSFLNTFATVLMLIPAVPLLRDVLLGILPIIRMLLGIDLPNGISDDLLATWSSLVLLAILGVGDQIGIRREAWGRLKERQSEWQQLITATEHRLKGTVLESCRSSIMGKLNLLVRPLEWLLSRLTKQAKDVNARLEAIRIEWSSTTSQNTSICRLVDLEQPWVWALEAVEEANQDDTFAKFTTSLIAGYMAQLLGGDSGLGSHIGILRQIEDEVSRLTQVHFESGPVYLLSVLMDADPRLQQGKLWGWLYQRAWPFGAGSHSFTVVLVESDEAPLHLPGGDETNKRDESWHVVHTGLRHEVVCIRGVY